MLILIKLLENMIITDEKRIESQRTRNGVPPGLDLRDGMDMTHNGYNNRIVHRPVVYCGCGGSYTPTGSVPLRYVQAFVDNHKCRPRN